jgi:hypothetical protein
VRVLVILIYFLLGLPPRLLPSKYYYGLLGSRDISVGKVTAALGNQVIRIGLQAGAGGFFSSIASRLALEPIQPPTQVVWGHFLWR